MSQAEEKVIGSGLDTMDIGVVGSDSCFGDGLIGSDGTVDVDCGLTTGGTPCCHGSGDISPTCDAPSTPTRRVDAPFIGPLIKRELRNVEDMKTLNPGFDDGDARRLLIVEKSMRSRGRAYSTPPPLTNTARKALKEKYKKLRGYSTPPRGTKHYSKREKEIMLSVKQFNETEAANYAEVNKRVDDYSREWIDRVAAVPFSSPAG